MPTKGKIEGLIIPPSGLWPVDVDDAAGGPQSITFGVAAGQYLEDVGGVDGLLTDFQDAADDGGGGWSITIDAGEGGTGKVTIDCSDTPFSVTWTDTELRDLLGFTSDISGATSAQTGARQAVPIWLPDGHPVTPFDLDDFDGIEEDDLHAVEAPGGVVHVVGGQTKYVLEMLWTACSKANVRTAAEGLVNESFQSFRASSIRGDETWARPGGPVAIWTDADAGTPVQFKVAGRQLRRFTAEKLVQRAGYTLHWNVPFERLVKVPA